MRLSVLSVTIALASFSQPALAAPTITSSELSSASLPDTIKEPGPDWLNKVPEDFVENEGSFTRSETGKGSIEGSREISIEGSREIIPKGDIPYHAQGSLVKMMKNIKDIKTITSKPLEVDLEFCNTIIKDIGTILMELQSLRRMKAAPPQDGTPLKDRKKKCSAIDPLLMQWEELVEDIPPWSIRSNAGLSKLQLCTQQSDRIHKELKQRSKPS